MTIHDLEARESVRAAQWQLSLFEYWWRYLKEESKPSVLRQAMWSLTLCYLDNQAQAELRLKSVADCAGISVLTLTTEVKVRALFLEINPAARDDKYRELLCRLLMS